MIFAGLEMDGVDAVGTMLEPLEAADTAVGAGAGRPLAQPLVKLVAIDHAHEATLNRNIHIGSLGRDHACRCGTSYQQRIGNRIVLDQTRRNRAAAGLDAAGSIKQQDRAALECQLMGCGGTCRSAADNNHIEDFALIHVLSSFHSGDPIVASPACGQVVRHLLIDSEFPGL